MHSGINLEKENYDFSYSNYGYAILGEIIRTIYDTDYTSLINDFVLKELGLTNTKVSEQAGDLGNYWEWKEDDASTKNYKIMDIHMDEIGMAVVILSNLSPNYRIPATVLGVKLLKENAYDGN